jgi:hypothetical protein
MCANHHLSLDCGMQELPYLLPLLARWRGWNRLYLHVRDDGGSSDRQLTPDAVRAMCALMQATPCCTELSLLGALPHPAALLLPVLVATSVVDIGLDDDCISETQLMLWCDCGGATLRPFIVSLKERSVTAGCVSNVRAALAEAGSAVKLQLLDNRWQPCTPAPSE